MEFPLALIFGGLELYLVPKMILGALTLCGAAGVAMTDAKEKQACDKCGGKGHLQAFDSGGEALGELSCRKCGGTGRVSGNE